MAKKKKQKKCAGEEEHLREEFLMKLREMEMIEMEMDIVGDDE